MWIARRPPSRRDRPAARSLRRWSDCRLDYRRRLLRRAFRWSVVQVLRAPPIFLRRTCRALAQVPGLRPIRRRHLAWGVLAGTGQAAAIRCWFPNHQASRRYPRFRPSSSQCRVARRRHRARLPRCRAGMHSKVIRTRHPATRPTPLRFPEYHRRQPFRLVVPIRRQACFPHRLRHPVHHWKVEPRRHLNPPSPSRNPAFRPGRSPMAPVHRAVRVSCPAVPVAGPACRGRNPMNRKGLRRRSPPNCPKARASRACRPRNRHSGRMFPEGRRETLEGRRMAWKNRRRNLDCRPMARMVRTAPESHRKGPMRRKDRMAAVCSTAAGKGV